MIIKHIAVGRFTSQELDSDDIPIDRMKIKLKGPSVIAVDPSTSSSGIIFASLELRKPVHMLAVVRNKKKQEDYVNYNTLLYALLDMWFTENPGKVRDMKLEQPVKTPYQKQENYAKQMAVFHIFKGLAKKHSINCIVVSPAKWRSLFLQDYKESMHLKLSAANKKEVHMIAASMQEELTFMPDDTTDAYGILQHYFAVDYREDGRLLATGDNQRERTHRLIYAATNQSNLAGYLTSYLEQAQYNYKGAELKQFEYNPKLSLEDNFRCFTSSQTNSRYHVYFAEIYPSLSIFSELVPFREYVGKISDVTPLYVVGYRVN